MHIHIQLVQDCNRSGNGNACSANYQLLIYIAKGMQNAHEAWIYPCSCICKEHRQDHNYEQNICSVLKPVLVIEISIGVHTGQGDDHLEEVVARCTDGRCHRIWNCPTGFWHCH